MYRLLLCVVLVGLLVLPAVTQAEKPAKILIAHIADAMVTGEEPVLDPDTGEVIGTAYTVTGYYNVIEVSENAVKGHEGHSLEVSGATFEDMIDYDGTKGDKFTVEEVVEVLD